MDAAHKPRATPLWEPRRALTLEQARRRTKLVVWLRRGLLAIAASGVGALAIFLVVYSVQRELRSIQILREADQSDMINPQFSGRDKNGRAFTISAARAARRRDSESIIAMEAPVLLDSRQTRIDANAAIYDQDARRLSLSGNVVLSDAGGAVYRTTRAEILLDEERVIGNEPISGESETGALSGDAFEIEGGGERIILKGNVKARFNDRGNK